MKILNILSEDLAASHLTSQNTLNSLELRTLKRLDNGVVDVDTASERELDLILQLIDMGLVNADGELTDGGKEAILPLDTNVALRGNGQEVDDLNLDDVDNAEVDDDDLINFDLNKQLGN